MGQKSFWIKCGVWCHGSTTCPQHVGPPYWNRILKNWGTGVYIAFAYVWKESININLVDKSVVLFTFTAEIGFGCSKDYVLPYPTAVVKTRLCWFVVHIDGLPHDSLHWRHNGHDSVSNNQPHDCLLNWLFRRRSKKTSKLRVTGLCAGNSTGTGEFPAQMASKMFPFDDVIMCSNSSAYVMKLLQSCAKPSILWPGNHVWYENSAYVPLLSIKPAIWHPITHTHTHTHTDIHIGMI